MRLEIAEAEKRQLEDDDRVESAEIKENYRGPYIEITPTDAVAAGQLKAEVDDWQTWVEVAEL